MSTYKVNCEEIILGIECLNEGWFETQSTILDITSFALHVYSWHTLNTQKLTYSYFLWNDSLPVVNSKGGVVCHGVVSKNTCEASDFLDLHPRSLHSLCDLCAPFLICVAGIGIAFNSQVMGRIQ